MKLDDDNNASFIDNKVEEKNLEPQELSTNANESTPKMNSNQSQGISDILKDSPNRTQHLLTDSNQTIEDVRKRRCVKRPIQSQEDDGKENEIQHNIAPTKRCKSEKRTLPAIRFNHSTAHFPKIDKNRQVRCKNEGCSKNHTYSALPAMYTCLFALRTIEIVFWTITT